MKYHKRKPIKMDGHSGVVKWLRDKWIFERPRSREALKGSYIVTKITAAAEFQFFPKIFSARSATTGTRYRST
jgi:hypothetical protein